MSEHITLITGSKEEKYTSLLPQIKALIDGESDRSEEHTSELQSHS